MFIFFYCEYFFIVVYFFFVLNSYVNFGVVLVIKEWIFKEFMSFFIVVVVGVGFVGLVVVW